MLVSDFAISITFGEHQLMAQLIAKRVLISPLIHKDFPVRHPRLARGNFASVNLHHQKRHAEELCTPSDENAALLSWEVILLAKSEERMINVRQEPENRVWQRTHTCEIDFASSIKSDEDPTSFTSVGSDAGSPKSIPRSSPATGHNAEMLEVEDPDLSYDAEQIPSK